jgi:Tol biopolymer transport system component
MSLDEGTIESVLLDSATNLYAVRSPSYHSIAFASDARGRYDVYRMAPDGSELERLSDAEGHHTQPVWTPDGDQIVFTSTRTGTPQIFRMLADGQAIEQLTRGEVSSHSPAVSPDGGTVAFVRGRGNDERVYLMDPDGEDVRPAQMADPGRLERSPHFFPNGDLAAVVRIGSTATAVVRWDRERDMRVPLVTSDGAIRSFAVSRDGRFLVVVIESTTRGGKTPTEVLLVDIARHKSTPLAMTLAADTRVASPSF